MTTLIRVPFPKVKEYLGLIETVHGEPPWSSLLVEEKHEPGLTLKSKSSAQKCRVSTTLARLDTWVLDDLKKRVLSRQPQCITRGELGRIVVWKQGSHTWRPNLRHVKSNGDTDVMMKTSQALQKLREDNDGIESAVKFLAVNGDGKLKGVGPATAACILCPFSDGRIPCMYDASLVAVELSKEYNLGNYIKFIAAIGSKVKELEGEWNPFMASRALWASGLVSRNSSLSISEQPSKRKKKKKEKQ